MLKAIRHRPVQAVVIALLSALVTSCAILAPLQQRAIDQASAQVELGRASASAEVLQLESSGFVTSNYTGGGQPARALTPTELAGIVPRSIGRSFEEPVLGQYVGIRMPSSAPHASDGDLAWRADACAHVRLSSGQCPSAAGQVLVSADDARIFGWKVGASVDVLEQQPDDARERAVEMRLTVVGTYEVPHDPYWDTWILVGKSGTKPDRNAAVQHDTWLTDPATFQQEPAPRNPSSRVDLRIRHSVTDVDELLRTGTRISELARDQARRSGYIAIVNVRSEIPAVAKAVRHAQHQARVTIPALMVPLGVLGLVVLWMALGSAVEQRRPEVALARLRGRGVRGAQAHLVRELLATVLAGVPLGVVAACLLAWPARALMLPGEVPLEIRAPALLGLLLAVVAVSAAVLVATTPVSREPVIALIRRIPPRRSGWGLGTADAVLVTVAALILFSFATGRLTGPIALVAPAVLAVGGGLVLARVLVAVAARAGAALLRRGAAATGVGLLQLARRPGIRATTALFTVAAAILVFAGDAVAVGSRNRTVAADQQVGAPAVLTVAGGGLDELERALADSGVPGDAATPVVVQPAVSGRDQTVLYVDSTRFASIGAFSSRSRATAALHRLVTPTADPIRVTGRLLTLTVATDRFYAGTDHSVGLDATLLGDDGTVSSVPLGTLASGTTPGRRVEVPIPCAAGCVLIGWRLTTTPANAGTGRLVLADAHTDAGGPVSLGSEKDWRPIAAGESELQSIAADAHSLTLFADNAGASDLVLEHAWIPEHLPAVVSGVLPPDAFDNEFAAHGLDGVGRSMSVAGRLPWMPATAANAAIADLGLAERTGAALSDDALLQVWLARTDRELLDRVRSALAVHHLQVADVARASEVRRELDRSAATWSLQLGVLVGAAGLLVAVLGAVIAGAGSWRSRARDLAALRLNGVALSDVRRISVVEQVPSMVAAVLAGAVIGVVAAHYALPTLPLLPADPPVDLIDLSPAWRVVLLLGAVAAVVLGLVGWAAARAVAGAARPERIEEAS